MMMMMIVKELTSEMTMPFSQNHDQGRMDDLLSSIFFVLPE